MNLEYFQIEFLVTTFKEWSSSKKLYDSSIDKNTARYFHKNCDGIRNTVTLIHSKENGHIIGGFAAVAWTAPDGYTCVKDVSAFLFSTNRKEVYQ